MKVKRTLVCLTALLMVCGAAMAEPNWTGTTDRNAANADNWSETLAPGVNLWVNGGPGQGSTSPIVTGNQSAITFGRTVIGFDGANGGELTLEATGKLAVGELKLGWDGTTTLGASPTVVSLTDATSELWCTFLQVGRGAANATLNNSGVIHSERFYVGGWDGADEAGSGDANLLAGDLWVNGSGMFKISPNSNVDITGGTLMLRGDYTTGALSTYINTLIGDDRLTGYGASADSNIQVNFSGGDWSTITAIPEPATLSMVALFGAGMLWVRKHRMV